MNRYYVVLGKRNHSKWNRCWISFNIKKKSPHPQPKQTNKTKLNSQEIKIFCRTWRLRNLSILLNILHLGFLTARYEMLKPMDLQRQVPFYHTQSEQEVWRLLPPHAVQSEETGQLWKMEGTLCLQNINEVLSSSLWKDTLLSLWLHWVFLPYREEAVALSFSIRLSCCSRLWQDSATPTYLACLSAQDNRGKQSLWYDLIKTPQSKTQALCHSAKVVAVDIVSILPCCNFCLPWD